MIQIDFDMPINCSECPFITEFYSCDLSNVKTEYKSTIRPKGCPLIEVTPQQKVGKWIDSNLPQEKYVCSECGGACWYYDYEGSVAKSKYCPNCGAYMAESEE